ncbi:DUF2202 domain-containing protein [Magnetospira sp. QH-2]|uniref:DUF2202 domain-containing protein n=1 Tax=Magnetospira sp. (strain QH-2) TaxID=1288970 RepID=UPI0003E81468|nr:DUF2202 domain-containing protein [Magnetospira sp. QH-2]CCQ72981.1 conserved protein of unknown function [Magnetospira sp. QH-2]
MSLTKPGKNDEGAQWFVLFLAVALVTGVLILVVDSMLGTNAPQVTGLSKQEVADLQYMREEEKLARDVYLDLFERWQIPMFKRIAQAEQRHMDAVGGLLTRYRVPDPAMAAKRGEFMDSHLADLYQELTAKGQASLQAGLAVGALIEEVDIADLDKALENTQRADIRDVYRTIRRGSRNHLRSFAGQLSARGAPYKAKVLTARRVNRILSSPMETGQF